MHARRPITYVNRELFEGQLRQLPSEHQFLVQVAIQEILSLHGLDLARTKWLRALGSGLWEFRIGPTSRAVLSKASLENTPQIQQQKILIRVFCAFEEGKSIIVSLFNKQRYGGDRRQNEAIKTARATLLTFRRQN
jgi:hypothetical protein